MSKHPRNKKQSGVPEKKGGRAKKILSFLAFALINVGVIVYIAVKEFGSGASEAGKLPVHGVNLFFILAAAACFGLCILMETFKYEAMLRAAEGRSNMRAAFDVAVLGKYYDNITPLGAGGQPFQVYYLKKRGFSTGTSAALPIAGFLFLQLAFVLTAVVVFVFNGKVMQSVALRISAYIGLCFYLFLPLVIILFSLMPKTLGRIIKGFIWIFHRIHIVKDYAYTVEKTLTSLEEYRSSLVLLSKTPMLFAKIFFFSLIYQVSILSIPFFVLRAFGSDQGWLSVFCLCVFIYAAIAYIPTPGNAGAAEGSFYAIFSSLNSGYLFWAVLIWRFFCYYGFLLMGLGLYATSSIKVKRGANKRRPRRMVSSVQFADSFYPVVDGVSRVVGNYAARMNEGEYACVVCPRAPVPYRDEFGYDVIRTPAVRLPFVDYFMPCPSLKKGLKKFLKEKNFTAFHAHSPFAMGKYALKMGRKLGVPVIATFHRRYSEDVSGFGRNKLFARMLSNSMVKFYCHADEVWTSGRSTAELLKSYGYRGEIHIVGSGTDYIGEYVPDSRVRELREELGIDENKKVLLFVGSLSWQNHLKLLLETVGELKSRSDQFVLLIAGQGRNEKQIKVLAERLGLLDSVRFLGQINNRSKLLSLFAAADLFVYPSVAEEAPAVVREAAALCLPSMLATTAGAAECVSDGINGYTAENDSCHMAERIVSIFQKGDMKTVGEAARDTLPVSWEEIVREVADRYRKASKARARSAR